MNSDSRTSDSNKTKETKPGSASDFVTPGFLLFLDNLIISIAGWIYWVAISKLTIPSELGLAVTVYSLVILVTTIVQLGLEYPLLKRSNDIKSKILSTAFVIELFLTVASIPFVYILINTVYENSVVQYTWLSISLLVILSLEFVFRFALLGISKAKIVLIIDVLGVIVKLSTGLILVYLGTGTLGILLAYLFEGFLVIFASLYFVVKLMSFRCGNITDIKETVKDAIINTPAKYSKMVAVILSIVLLSILNISASDIGIFYVALMITIVVASFASSMAYMVIPSSMILKKDLTSSSIKISLALTAPIVVALMVAPRTILSLINPEYVTADLVLFILALGIIPSSLTINLVSKLNNLNKSRMLILTGILQIIIFCVSFLILVPLYGIVGASISILITYSTSSIILMIITKLESLRYILFACLSVVAGFIVGYIMNLFFGQEVLTVFMSVAASIIVIFASKCLTIAETNVLIKGMLRKN